MSDRLEAAVDAAFAASNAWGNRSRQVVFVSPSKDQVRATIRAEFDRAEAAEARLEEIRQLITTFPRQRVCGTDALEAFEGIRQILDREPQP